MIDREDLPAKSPSRNVSAQVEQHSTIVGRGLAAVREMGKQQLSLPTEEKAERLFKLGMHYLDRYQDGEGGTQQDADKARGYLTGASELRHAEAQYELYGLLTGSGDDEDIDKSIQWLESSANLGFGPALFDFATHLLDLPEKKRQRDDWLQKARTWYETRAKAGDAERQFDFAVRFLKGEAWGTESEEYYRWLKASAEQDYVPACKVLAHAYLKGNATEHATQQGIYWLSHAADLGSGWACEELGELYLRGHLDKYAERKGRVPQCRIAPAKAIAVSWYERGIEMGFRGLAYKLGVYYLEGKVLDQDPQLAEKWLLRSGNDGHDSAQMRLGAEYASGARLRQDSDAAIHWWRLAAEKSKHACLRLAEIYLEGKIVAKNFDQAIAWLTRPASSWHHGIEAIKMVAEKCFDGRFNAAQESIAQAWLERMAALALDSVSDLEDRDAPYRTRYMGALYELGLGVEQDWAKAIYWYTQSAKSGNPTAQKRLKDLGHAWEAA